MISKQLKNQLLEEIKPTKHEESTNKELVEEFVQILNENSKNYDVDFYVGGSFGKRTYLRDNFDVDIFSRFSQKYSDDKISSYLEDILIKANIKYSLQKGSRNYFSGLYKSHKGSFVFELVPTRRIRSVNEGVNSTDFSFMHVEFVKNELTKNPKLADEIRLTKKLFKSKKFYGAESYICGFSGHSIDLLIIYYQSFENFLINAKNWKIKQIIDVANHYNSDEEILNEIDNSKHSSLIIVDSIIPTRNASKALSNQKFGEFLVWVNSIEKLSREDFIQEKIDLSKIIKDSKKYSKELDSYFLGYELELGEVESEDIAGSKIKKLYEKLEKFFQNYDFELIETNFYIDENFKKAIFLYHIKYPILINKKIMRGPPVDMSEAVVKIINNYKNYFVEENRLWYLVNREITSIEEIEDIEIHDLKKFMKSKINFIQSISKIK